MPRRRRGGEYVKLEPLRETGQVTDKAMAPGDLEGHERDLPWPTRRLERPLDATHVEHIDHLGPELDGASDGDAVDDPAVEEVLSLYLDGRQDARHGRGGKHGIDERPRREPTLGGGFDACGDALEPHGQILDESNRKRLL
jgi:hypothetical protein